MKKVFAMLVVLMVLFTSSNVLACNGVTVHSGFIWDDSGCLIDFLDEGVDVDILEQSQVFPERTNICVNGIIGSFYTEYLSYYDFGDSYCPVNIEDVEVYEDFEQSEDCENFEVIEDFDYSLLAWEFEPTGIYSRVTADLVLRDMNGNFIDIVPCGELVEVLCFSPIDSDRMIVNFCGLQGSVLACYIEQTYADNINTPICSDVSYCHTGIYSRVTGNLVVRDDNYCQIGLVPNGALVEVIQFSHYYPERMDIIYNGIYGSVLACYIEQTYADNI